MAFDGIVTKSICSELSYLSGCKIDKIFQYDKNSLLIGMYLDGKNYCLNICIDSNLCRLNLTTHNRKNPKIAPNFCMVLRKNLIGLHLKNIFTLDLERVIVIEFEGFDEIDDILNKKLIIELMGKHGNIILLDENNLIIDSLRHIKSDNISFRNILPNYKYNFPKSNKYNFLDYRDFTKFYNTFTNCFKNLDLNSYNFENIFCSNFNGFSKSFVLNILNYIISNSDNKYDNKILKINNTNILSNELFISFLKDFHTFIFNIIDSISNGNIILNYTYDTNGIIKDYYPLYKTKDNKNSSNFSLNFFIDDFYYEKENLLKFNNLKKSLEKTVLGELTKYEKRLKNIEKKLNECTNMEKYRRYGELITANLYLFNPNSNLENITVSNYYDNNNEICIPLDKRFNIIYNSKKYYKKYTKLKNALNIVSIQKKDTENEINYLKSVIYEIETSKKIDELYEISNEINESILKNDKKINNKKSKNNKSNFKISFNPLKYIIDGYTVLVGRNNKENDFLTLKYANKSDIWFHVKDFHGSHVILKFLNKNNSSISKTENILDIIPNDLIDKVSKLAISHSKAKNSINSYVDYCEVRYVKKPTGAKPGMVIYTNYKSW